MRASRTSPGRSARSGAAEDEQRADGAEEKRSSAKAKPGPRRERRPLSFDGARPSHEMQIERDVAAVRNVDRLGARLPAVLRRDDAVHASIEPVPCDRSAADRTVI